MVLIAWLNVDAAVYGVCPGDMITAPTTGLHLSDRAATGHAGRHVHPEHCFCHALWMRVAARVGLADPAGASRPLADTVRRAPGGPARALDHPPQLAG